MKKRSHAPFAALIVRVSLLSLLAPVAAAVAAAPGTVPGDQWEMTTKMSMAEMPMQMPAQTSKICRPKGKAWDEPPTSRMAQERCKMTDYKLSGNKASWKVTCSDGMSGTGDMTYQADSFAGTMTITSEDVSMKMEMTGRKVGDCDATETVRTIEQARKAGEETDRVAPADPMAKVCTDAAARVERVLFIGPAAICKKDDQKAAFCKHLSEEAAYDRLARESSPQQDVVAEVASFCGTSADGIRNTLCKHAVEAESLDFLAQTCAKEAKVYAAQHCAGRKVTTIPQEKVRLFCTSYAEKLLATE